MAFMGEIGDIGVADLLYLLALRQQTGRLAVVANGDEVSLFLDQGRMILVTSSNASLRLGRMLIRLDFMTNERLREALKHQEQQGAGRSLGTILIEGGFITEAQLHQCIEEQCIEVLARVIAAEAGVFVFHRGEQTSPRTEIVPLNPDKIMLEATRRTDELSALRAQLPDMLTPLRVSEMVDSMADQLTDIEIQIASILFENPTSVRNLMLVVTIDDATLWRTIVSMRVRGLVVAEDDVMTSRTSTQKLVSSRST